MTTFFTSDHHFGDARRLGIDRRPFADVAEMDRVMAERWNETVGPDDAIWHLGDVTRHADPPRVDALLSRLSGRKHLIAGNTMGPPRALGPDGRAAPTTPRSMSTGSASCSATIRSGPGTGWAAARSTCMATAHGRLKPVPRQHDVGIDARDFRPIPLTALLKGRR